MRTETVVADRSTPDIRNITYVGGKGGPLHHYFHGDPDITDVQKMRDEATARAMAKGIFDKFDPESSIIHHHKHSEPCGEQRHEYYRRTVGRVDSKGEMQ